MARLTATGEAREQRLEHPEPLLLADVARGDRRDGVSRWASFSFGGIPFDVSGVPARIGKGATILSATAEVTFSGLLTYKEQGSGSFQKIGASGTAETLYRTINGEDYIRFSRDADGNVLEDYENPDPDIHKPVSTQAAISWVLMSVRLDSAVETDVNGTPADVPRNRYRTIGTGIGGSYDDGKSRVADLTDAIQALVDNRDRVSSSCFWWPTRGTASPGASPDSLAGYVEGLLPPASIEGETSCNRHERFWSYTTQQTAWSSLSFGDVIIRFRDAEGALNRVVFPIIRPPAMPAS